MKQNAFLLALAILIVFTPTGCPNPAGANDGDGSPVGVWDRPKFGSAVFGE